MQPLEPVPVEAIRAAHGRVVLVERNRLVAEGAGATSVAAALAGEAGRGKVVCVVSGGNDREKPNALRWYPGAAHRSRADVLLQRGSKLMTDGHSTTEDQWFQEKEARLRRRIRENMERHAVEERNKREIAGTLGTDDAALVARIQGLGLDGDTVRVIHLLPLVQVAWSDGSVSVSERQAILEAVKATGVEPGSAAATLMASLLESRPSSLLLDEILAILRDLLKAKGMRSASLLEACENVAKASGGLLGMGNKVSSEERDAIHRVAEALGPHIDEKVSAKLG